MKCDICHKEIPKDSVYIDGKTRMGPWATMCKRCHRIAGVGLGTGRGQQYGAGDHIKIKG